MYQSMCFWYQKSGGCVPPAIDSLATPVNKPVAVGNNQQTNKQKNKQALLNGFLKRRKRDSAFFILAIVLVSSVWLLWPILFSLRVDRTTSMSWAAVWIPLWIADGIGELSAWQEGEGIFKCNERAWHCIVEPVATRPANTTLVMG